VVQEHVQRSTTPVLVERRAAPRALAVARFAVAARDDYVVMPAAVARAPAATAAPSLDAARRRQQGHLDHLATSGQQLQPAAAVNRPGELSRGGSDLPSRAADNLYWLGRYAERARAWRGWRACVCAPARPGGPERLRRSTEFVPLLRTLHRADLAALHRPTRGAVASTSRRPRSSCWRRCSTSTGAAP
jgi:hypothetical protein